VCLFADHTVMIVPISDMGGNNYRVAHNLLTTLAKIINKATHTPILSHGREPI
jgi:hypothetical protein